MIENYLVYKSVGGSGDTVTKLSGNRIKAHTNNSDIVYLYADLATTNVVYARFVYQKYYNSENISLPPIKLMTVADDEVSTVIETQLDGYHLWKYPLPNSITGVNNSGQNMGVRISFQVSELEQPDEYLGIYTTTETTDVAINTALKTAYATATEDDYVNVLKTTANEYESFKFDGTDWIAQDSLLNQVVTGETSYYNETILPNSASTNEVVNRDITDDIVAELAEQRTEINGLSGAQTGLMDKATYDTDNDGYVDGAESLNDGTNVVTAAEAKEVVDWVNQDLNENTGTPSFASMTLYNALGTAIATYDGQDVIFTYGGKSVEMAKNLFIRVKATVAISNGDVVQYAGSIGASGKIEGKPAVPSEINVAPYLLLGVATEDISVGQEGEVNFYGRVNNVNTLAYSAGDILYYDSASADGVNDGGYTTTEPTAPNVQCKIAIVTIDSATVGQLAIRPDYGDFLSDLHDVYLNGGVSDGDVIKYNGTNLRWEKYALDTALDARTFVKTGWPIGSSSLIKVSMTDATRTVTLSKISADVDYYISNVKYTLSTDKTVVIDDTEGLWYIYLVGETLTASQTAWNILSADKCLVATAYWDATNNECVSCTFEGHTFDMSPTTHYNNHNAIGTYIVSGLVASDNGSDGIDVTAGYVADEDVLCQIVDDDTPTNMFEQPLTPLKSYKYYRSGASGLLRKVDDSTTPVYLLSNAVQLNPYSGGTYSLSPMTLNKYGAYWVVVTTDFNQPVKIFLGQTESDSLNNAIEDNGVLSMNFGQLPLPEIKVAYRYIVQQLAISPYYSIEQVDSFVIDPSLGTPSDPASSHGALSGLGDDDHTQYFNSARLAAATELDGRYYTETEMDTALGLKVDKSLASYTSVAAAAVADEDLAYVYLDNNGAVRKMTLTEVYAGANTATGSFVASSDYAGDGLGAYKSALSTIHQLTGSAGQYLVNVMDIDDMLHAIVLFPDTSADTTATTQISFDNGTTYRTLKFDNQDIPVADLASKLVHIYRDGTGLVMYEAPSLIKNVAYTGADGQHTIGANGIGHAITKKANTAPTDIRGRTIEQLVSNPDFDSGISLWFTLTGRTLSDQSGELRSTSVAGDTPYIAKYLDGYVLQNAVDYYYSFYGYSNASATVNFALAEGTDSDVTSANDSDNLSFTTTKTKFSGILTSIGTETNIRFNATSLTTTADWIQIDNVQLIPLPSDITTVAQAEAMLDGTILSQGLHSVGDSRVYAVADYPQEIQDYIEADGTVAGDTIQGVYTLTTAKNKFDKSKVTLDYYVNKNTGELVASLSAKAVSDYIPITNNASYIGVGLFTGDANAGVAFYDSNKNYISGVNTATFTTPSNAKYLKITLSNSTVDTTQLELGTTATTYEPYEYSVQHTDGVLYGIGGVYDDENTQRFDRDYNDVVQSATYVGPIDVLTNTHTFYITKANLGLDLADIASTTTLANIKLRVGTTIFTVVTQAVIGTADTENTVAVNASESLLIRVNKTTYPDSAGFEAYLQANDVEFIYELATYLPRTIDNANLIPINGTHIVSPYSTWHSYGGGLVPQFDMESAYSLAGAYDINVDTDIAQGKVLTNHESRLDQAESEIDTLQSDVGDASTLDTTSKEVVGAINEVHTELGTKVDVDGTKVLSDNNFTDTLLNKLNGIEANATADQTAGEIKTAYESNADTNAYTDAEKTSVANISGIKTKTDNISVTASINLDKVPEYTIIYSSTLNVPNANPGSANITLSSATTNYKKLIISGICTIDSLNRAFTEEVNLISAVGMYDTYIEFKYASNNNARFRINQDTTTTLRAYDTTTIATTPGSPANIVESTTYTGNVTINEIIGIAY